LAQQGGDEPVDDSSRVEELSAERDRVETQLRSEAAELVALAARLRDLSRQRDELAAHEERLSGELTASIAELSEVDVGDAFHAVIDDFTRGERIPGRLPLVLSDMPPAFAGDGRHRTLRELERVSRERQVVLVARDGDMIEPWVRDLGADCTVWSPAVADAAEAEERIRAEAEAQARRDAERRAVEAAAARERAEAEAKESTSPAPAEEEPPPEPDAVVDLTGDSITLSLGTDDPTPNSDDWIAPFDPRPGAVRAARPVGEDLEQRRRRAEQIVAEHNHRDSEPGDAPLVLHCDVHRTIDTTLRCVRCRLPFCDQCLVMLGEPPSLHCVDCALELWGARRPSGSG
jgi:hypothetical protein